MKRFVLICLFLFLLVACQGNSDIIERATFTKATSHCDVIWEISIPISLLEQAVIEEEEWKCTTGDTTIHYKVYHVYKSGKYGWYLNENPLEILSKQKGG